MFLLRRAKVMSWCKNKDRERGKRYDDERTIVIRGDTHNRHHHHHHLCFWSRGYCLIYILWKKMGEKKMFSTFFFHHQRRNENFSGYILNAKAVCQQHTHTHIHNLDTRLTKSISIYFDMSRVIFKKKDRWTNQSNHHMTWNNHLHDIVIFSEIVIKILVHRHNLTFFCAIIIIVSLSL